LPAPPRGAEPRRRQGDGAEILSEIASDIASAAGISSRVMVMSSD
jgi:hypothetical protein